MFEIDDKKIYFPIKHKPRVYQLEALEFIKKSILNGKQFMVCNLPTGTGKSMLVATMFTNWYRNFINKNAKFDILTNSKILQDQYLQDFEFIKNYKGRSNYYCDQFSTDCATGAEMNRIIGKGCTSCPYDIAKNKWIYSDVGITNFHLFNTLSLYQKNVLESRNANVLIVDECHDYDSVFSTFISTELNAHILKRCGLTLSEVDKYDKSISRIKKIDNYLDFLENNLVPFLKTKEKLFEFQINVNSSKELLNYLQNTQSKILSFGELIESYKVKPDNFTLDIEQDKKEKMYSGLKLITQPIWVHEYLNEMVWKRYDHIIFMSGTILNKKIFCFLNGLEDKLTTYHQIPSPFKIRNRPIYYIKLGKMNFSSKEETFLNQLVYIKKILNKYKDKKGIIHTNSYELTEWLQQNIQDKRLLFHETENKQEVLDKHISSKSPTVIVSPSMSNGVNLKDDLSRFQIILKVPYPNLGSNAVKARQKLNPEWYSITTISTLIQTYGRSVRSESDYCDTFILDSNFSDLLKYNFNMIPNYFSDAIKELKL